MKDSHINICGITPQCKLPKIPYNYPYTEICETHILSIPNCKPIIKNILQIFIDSSIKTFKVINTPVGNKLLVNGFLHIRIIYNSDIDGENICQANFDIPLYAFIKLANMCKKVERIYVLIQDVLVNKIDSKKFSISCLLFIYPIFETEMFCQEICNNQNNDYNDYDTNINLDNNYDSYQDTNCTQDSFIESNFSADNDIYLEFNIEHDMNSNTIFSTYNIDNKEYFECDFK